MVAQDEIVSILGVELYNLPLGILRGTKCEFNPGLRQGRQGNELVL